MVFAEVKPKSSTVRKSMPMYKVLLHNDDHTPMEYVVEVLVKIIPAMNPQQAFDIMMEAHNSGSAVVIVVNQEHAEFYKEQLQTHGLTSTIEPDT